jgi:hypothetical protein
LKGGTEYTVNATVPADPVGATFTMERDDQLATLTEVETDWTNPRATSKGALWVAIPDASGDPITSFGGGTQYTEDAAAPADPVGGVQQLVRLDTPGTLTTTDNDIVSRRGTNYGAAYTQIVTSSGAFVDSFGGSGGTAQADRSTFTDGTTNMTPIGGVYNETDTNPTEDQAAAVRINVDRALHVSIQQDVAGLALAANQLADSHNVTVDNAGAGAAVNIQDGGNIITVDGTVTANAGTGSFTVVGNKSNNGGVPGATNLGTLPAVANAAAPTHTETNQVALRTQLDGDLVVEMEDALPAGDNNVGNVDVASMPSNTTATGTLTAPAQVVTVTVPQGGSSIGLQVTGTWTGQIEFEATVDGTNYVSVYASNNSGTSTNATTVNGGFILPGAGFLTVQVRASALSSGTANISFNASVGTSGATLTGPIPAGTNNIGDVDVATIAGGDNNIGNVDIVTFPDNEPFNMAQISGTAASVNNGAADAGTLRVTVASDTTGVLSVDDNAGSLSVDFNGVQPYVGPCAREAVSRVSISQTAGAQLITGTASERIYICSLHIVTATAQNIALVSGTGTVCASDPSGVVGFGGSTAATGWNFAANGGIQMAYNPASYGHTDTDADNVCLLMSGSGQISGGLTYVSAASGL